jgi:ribonuclease P protein component
LIRGSLIVTISYILLGAFGIGKNSASRRIVVSVLKNGKKTGNEFFSLYVLDGDTQAHKLFVATIGKKMVKSSVKRNLYKRWIINAFLKYKAGFTGKTAVIMARRGLPKLTSYAGVEEALSPLLKG